MSTTPLSSLYVSESFSNTTSSPLLVSPFRLIVAPLTSASPTSCLLMFTSCFATVVVVVSSAVVAVVAVVSVSVDFVASVAVVDVVVSIALSIMSTARTGFVTVLLLSSLLTILISTV